MTKLEKAQKKLRKLTKEIELLESIILKKGTVCWVWDYENDYKTLRISDGKGRFFHDYRQKASIYWNNYEPLDKKQSNCRG